MTTASSSSQNKGAAASAGGRRVVKVSGRAIAAARAQVAISKTLGPAWARPVSETVQKIAVVR